MPIKLRKEGLGRNLQVLIKTKAFKGFWHKFQLRNLRAFVAKVDFQLIFSSGIKKKVYATDVTGNVILCRNKPC